MLTHNTQIPTSLRGQIRARVKAHAGWKSFLHQKGLLSASAKNADLIEFAFAHPLLKAQIEQILQSHQAAAPKESAATLMLATRIEKLLMAYAARTAPKPRIRVKAISQTAPDPLDDFNYVGSRHHY
jgi:hypothetical protein